ncbi:MAG: F0F1 ATP synthase subunit A [Ruminococcus sp.]|nr:F0F1 ATP synthase subunit A [Ruminococcus sp.]
MNDFAEKLMEELECRTAFTIPIFGGIPVPESAVITWVIMGVLVLLSILLTRRLRMVPKGSQCLIEAAITWMNNFFLETLGPRGKRYLPILETLLIYIGFANIVGIFGLRPPTKDLGVTASMAIVAIVLIQYASIKERGARGWLRSFKEPMPIMLPINILELAIKPLSLCMRLFGNVLGAFVVMELIKLCIPVGVPLVFGLYFDIFDGCIQAYVFVFLTSLFLSEAIEEAHS